MVTSENKFKGNPIRAEYDKESNEWFFSAIDIVKALVDSKNPRKYWHEFKKRLDEGQLSTKIGQLKLPAADGKTYKTDVLNKENAILIARRIKKSQDTEAFIEWLSKFDGTEKKYVLKHKDVDVLEIELDGIGSITSLGRIFNVEHLPVGTSNKKGGADNVAIKEWWRGRSIPASREGLRDLLDSLGMVAPQQLLKKSFGLSLSDQYWICPQNGDLRWEDVNFFHNSFSDDVGNLLFGKMEISDPKAISLLSPDNTSDGVLKKKWKIIHGKRCLIKGGSMPFY